MAKTRDYIKDQCFHCSLSTTNQESTHDIQVQPAPQSDTFHAFFCRPQHRSALQLCQLDLLGEDESEVLCTIGKVIDAFNKQSGFVPAKGGVAPSIG